MLGLEGILALDPYERVEDGKRPRPKGEEQRKPLICHASTKRLRDLYHEIYIALVAAYDVASAAFRAGDRDVAFPEGTFRPLGGFTDWTDATAPNALEWIESLSPA